MNGKKTKTIECTIGCLRGGKGRADALLPTNHLPPLTKVTIEYPDVPRRPSNQNATAGKLETRTSTRAKEAAAAVKGKGGK